MTLQDYILKPASGNTPTSLVVLLHGYGANGQDLLDLGETWKTVLPDTVFVSPDAPFPCEGAPMGRQWFGLIDLNPAALLAGVQQAQPILEEYFAGLLKKYSLTPDKMVIVGFSQGTMTGLYTVLRQQHPCAAMLGYSGLLLGDQLLAQELTAKPPVLLIHGEADPVVPVQGSLSAAEILKQHGLSVEARTIPGLPHGIDANGLAWGGTFLQTHLTKAA